MKTVEAIRAAARRRWDEGTEHRAHVLGEPYQPLSISLNPPSGRRLAAEFAEVRQWAATIEHFARKHELALEHQTVANQRVGRQRVPERLVLSTREAVLSVAGSQREFAAFVALCDHVLPQVPALQSLFATQPHRVMKHAGDWPAILRVLNFVAANDVSGSYLRELDLDGVDTKFIDTRKGILDEVLRAALPAEKVLDDNTGLSGHAFEQRYGFRFDQPLVRFRHLGNPDETLYDDVTVPLDQFAATPVEASTVFIVENKVNLLSFPPVPDAIAIFGQGYAVMRLAAVGWLSGRSLIYFGDLDTHGFAILDRLRKAFPAVRSMLMDRDTLLAHRHAWTEEAAAKRQLGDLTRLTREEQALFDDLRHNRLGKAVRLEQERVGFSRVINASRSLPKVQ